MSGNSNIPVEVFQNYAVEKLRKKNPFMQFATDESLNVIGGAVVHIPQAGNAPSAVKNRTVFPATAVMRGDSFVTYALDVFSTDPTHITWDEKNEISYEKTDSVLADHVETLFEVAGDNMLYAWVNGLKTSGGSLVAVVIPTTNIIRTSGADVAVNAEDGQTGNRKAFSSADVSKAQAVMNKQNVPATDRYLICESYMYQQLIDSLSANQMAAFQQSADLANGIVGKLFGFNIMERSTVLAFASNLAVKVPGEALAATDQLGALAWQKSSVAKAMGDVKPFQNTDDALYMGDVFSALIKLGGRCRRGDWKGLIAIVQDNAAV